MPKNVYEIQKENMDAAMKSFGAMSKAFQAIAVEFANYSKRSLEDHTAAAEKLMGAKSLEKRRRMKGSSLTQPRLVSFMPILRRSCTSRSRASSDRVQESEME